MYNTYRVCTTQMGYVQHKWGCTTQMGMYNTNGVLQHKWEMYNTYGVCKTQMGDVQH